MKKPLKMIAVLLVGVSILSFTACGQNQVETQSEQPKQEVQEDKEYDSIYTQSPLWTGIFKPYYDKCGTATYDEVVPQIKTLGLNVDDSYRDTQLNNISIGINAEIAVNVTDPNLPEYVGLSLYFDENDKLSFIEYIISCSKFICSMNAKEGGIYSQYTPLDGGESQTSTMKNINDASYDIMRFFSLCDEAAQVEQKYLQ